VSSSVAPAPVFGRKGMVGATLSGWKDVTSGAMGSTMPHVAYQHKNSQSRLTDNTNCGVRHGGVSGCTSSVS
jgi:hypothetical protein